MAVFQKPFKSILVFFGCFSFCFSVAAQPAEVKLLDNLNPKYPTSAIIRGVTNSVYSVSLATPASLLVVGFIQHDKNLQIKGWEAVGSLALNTIITQGMKRVVDRERPYQKYPLLIHPYLLEDRASFPSGHTSTAFSTATTLSLEFKKWYVVVPAYTYAVMVGYSRLYLGEHYPSDVFAGAVVGAGSAVLSHWLTKQVFDK